MQFNPVDLALQLLDSSVSGKDPDSFRQTKYMLSSALKGSINSQRFSQYIHVHRFLIQLLAEHYQAFAAALPHHSSVMNHLGATQVQVSDARSALQEAKDALGTKRSDLAQLSSRGQIIDEMLRLLDEMWALRSHHAK